MHIVFLNPQGNFDRNDSYWTMHPDFGGQLVYVKEIAIEMARMGHKIDIITRQFDDSHFPEFKDMFDTYEDSDHLRIIRIPCGPNRFIRKEQLWEYIDEWTDNILEFYENEGSMFDFATGHYGDGGLACALIKRKTGIPYSFTGHSLGAQKFDKLNRSFQNFSSLEQTYFFTKRILAERTAIQNSDVIFVSTSQERDEQYQHILYKDKDFFVNPSKFIIAPPGVNTRVFAPYWSENVDEEIEQKIKSIIKRDINTKRSELPVVILASRLDEKKNHVGVVEAFANDPALQERCNLMISLRGVDNAFNDYTMLKTSEIKIVNQLMRIIYENNLIGKVSFISINSQKELANLYRFAAKRGGAFVLAALYEPFGLAPIEAMSTGLPAAVTKYGGPSEVLEDNGEQFGVLLDVQQVEDISRGLNQLFDTYEFYQRQGHKRVLSKYTWHATAKTYIKAIKQVLSTPRKQGIDVPKYFVSLQKSDLDSSFILDQYQNQEEGS